MNPADQDWLLAMRQGDYRLAWEVSEALNARRNPATRNDPTLPYHKRWVWDGRDLTGRDVLVRCYHGLGDTIQFLRYLPPLRRRARTVTLEVQPHLAPLLAGAPPADRMVPFDVRSPLSAPECDIEIMELALALRIAPADLPPPYLTSPPAPLPAGTIGLCCKAGDWDEARSIPPELLAIICDDHPCISLDTGPSPLAVGNPGGCPLDIVETAALVSGVSLVITVDTMIAHLAGAMAKPVWLLLKHEPDWRWSPQSGRSDWYPSMRLYVQPEPGDWASVAEGVSADLARAPASIGADGA
jgi:hypothetical protein